MAQAPSCKRKVCRNVGPSQEPVHHVKADGPMVTNSESFRDGGENRKAERLPQADAVGAPGSQLLGQLTRLPSTSSGSASLSGCEPSLLRIGSAEYCAT